jgi:hypothetical protein
MLFLPTTPEAVPASRDALMWGDRVTIDDSGVVWLKRSPRHSAIEMIPMTWPWREVDGTDVHAW